MNCVQTSPRLAGQTRIVAEGERRLSGVEELERGCPPAYSGPAAFREARDRWSESFCAAMAAEFRSAMLQLPTIWKELPGDWTEVTSGITLGEVESLLWKFDRETDIFWRRL